MESMKSERELRQEADAAVAERYNRGDIRPDAPSSHLSGESALRRWRSWDSDTLQRAVESNEAEARLLRQQANGMRRILAEREAARWEDVTEADLVPDDQIEVYLIASNEGWEWVSATVLATGPLHLRFWDGEEKRCRPEARPLHMRRERSR